MDPVSHARHRAPVVRDFEVIEVKVMTFVAPFAVLVNVVTLLFSVLTGDPVVAGIAYAGACFSWLASYYYRAEARRMALEAINYRDLAIRIRVEIRELRLLPGQRLPSAVEYALAYNTTRATVLRALRLLEADSIVTCVQGRGTYVAGGEFSDRPKDRVTRDIMNVIEAAPAGTPIPRIDHLMHAHEVSRMTVHRALHDLVTRQLIARNRNGRYVKS